MSPFVQPLPVATAQGMSQPFSASMGTTDLDTRAGTSGSPARASSPPPALLVNNFDLLRLLLAVGVMLYHLHELTRQNAFRGFSKLTNPTALVQSFFVISGFLIFMSYEKSKSLRDYLEKRVRRIYPAYVVVILLCVAAGVFLTRLPLADYLSRETLRYLASNLVFLVFLQRTLPGVFENNLIHAVNGALWTLKIEVAFYLCVPLICWIMRRFNPALLLALLYTGSLVYAETWLSYAHPDIAKQFPGQLCFFVVGVALCYYFEKFSKYAALWFVLALGILRIDRVWPVGWLVPASLGAITIFLACFLPPLRFPGRLGDLSYGVYIYHFPIIQTLEHYGVFRWNPFAGLALTVALTFGFAFASWHFVEKRFLRRSSHYRQAAQAAPVAAPP